MSDPSNCLKFFMADNRVILATARTRGCHNSVHLKQMLTRITLVFSFLTLLTA